MKRAITIAIVFMSLCAVVSASSFDGLTSIGGNYEYRDGSNLGGLSSQSFGYFGECPVGYFVGVNADFNIIGANNMAIGIIAGPSYRYLLSNVPMSIEIAVGPSFSGQWFSGRDTFGLGVGGYIGATYYLNDVVALLIGCTLGYDMLSVDLSTGEASFYGNFYVSSSLSIGFRY